MLDLEDRERKMMRDQRYGDSRDYGAVNRRHWGNSSFRSPTSPRRPLPPSGRVRDRGGHSPPRSPRKRYHGDVEEERRGGEGGSLRRDYDSRRGDHWSRDNNIRRGDRRFSDHDYRSSSYGDKANSRGYDGNFNMGDRTHDRELDRTFGGGDSGDRGNVRAYNRSFSGDRGNDRGYDQNFSSRRNMDGNYSRGGDRISSNGSVVRARHYGNRERDLDDGQSQRMYQSGGNGEFSWRMYGAIERASSKFQSDQLLDETKNGLNSSFHHGVGSSRLGSDLNYDYHNGKFFDKSCDGNLMTRDSGRERNYASSSYPINTSFPTRTSCHVDATESASRYSSGHLEKDDARDFHNELNVGKLATPGLVRRDSLATESYKDKLPYSSTGIDYTISSSRLKGFDPVARGSFKENFSSSIRDDHSVPSDSNRLRTGMLTNPTSYEAIDENLGTRSPMNHEARYGDFKSYSQSYLGNAEENHKDYNYPEGDNRVAGRGSMFTEIYRKSLLEEESSLQNNSRLVGVDPVGNKPDVSSHEGYSRGSRLLDHHPTSHGLSISGPDDTYPPFSTRNDMEDQQCKDLEQPKYGRESYRGPGSSRIEEPNHVDEVALSPRYHHGQSDILTSREYDPHLEDADGNSNDEFMRNASFSKASSLLKRKHAGSEFDDLRGMNYVPGDADEVWSSNGNSSIHSGRLRVRNSSVSGTISITSSSRFRRSGISGARDIKNRLGPVSQKLHVSQRLVKRSTRSLKKRLGPAAKNHHTLPWLKNLNAPNLTRIEEDTGGSPQEDSVENNDTPVKAEPPENSEDFKQLVKIAFFKFVKQLNETPAKRRKYTKQGTGGNLKCIICQSQEEFVSTESLATHAMTCQKLGLRSQHLGFHKALCALMGWKFGEFSDSAWSCEKLSDVENKALKEDLILWPPVVIIHNSTIGSRSPDQQVVVTVEELEGKLRDMGFGDKAKVYRGKPANQSVMVVEFAGTLSGLREAERLHKVFAESKHGRVEFLEFKSSSNPENVIEAESTLDNKLDNILYGYWGISEDLGKLDFDAKKRRLVKSKKEIADIAEAPIKA
ncbi:OLC1v1013676C1 [Oldenlandia corymbosa var. corymbosa]|uniref:OLC1v1013676C1 n=1 Tax=Oldenlandia corymbosa var. corymbosa TaxID=529605 RepID=A0AAV1E2D6_OLDCO|nr:OLC1v1013676C1 [Oldenlandia corymbosa var. corymbosa]